VTVSKSTIVVGAVLLVVALGTLGYLVGASKAPSAAEAARAQAAARASAAQTARVQAYKRGLARGLKLGFEQGQDEGQRAGESQGGSVGTVDVKSRLAQIEQQQAAEAAAQAAAAQTPEQQCASLLNTPDAYGLCLESAGQDPAAPLTDYCAAHPEIVASAGFCPSLNE
jgi:pyruvate/2-oxoglutarate dehydrogenase complex dihydrolipoamide acyltransferase (E2) component